ncbi:MAG: ATP-dependent 6-phosphofructokinase, partial [Prochlorothrix sp.]
FKPSDSLSACFLESGMLPVLAGYKTLGLDALVVVGGDGSLDIICTLAEQGNWNVIGVPKTIDNDVPFTEQAVGFNTAVNTVTDALYDLTFTAASHDRVMVVQVMGRDAGHLGLTAGIAGGADVILIPERVPQLTDAKVKEICEHLARIRKEGRKFALIVVAEGVRGPSGDIEKNVGEILARRIKEISRHLCASGQEDFCGMEEVDTRSTVLGHIQRSGTPSAFDRLLATSYGTKAVELIAQGHRNQIVLWQGGKVTVKPLAEVLPVIRQCHRDNRCAGPVTPDSELVQVAQALGIYVG